MYRIESEFRHNGKSYWGVLRDGLYPKAFETNPTSPRLFATKGGARNYMKKWDINRARIVKHDSA